MYYLVTLLMDMRNGCQNLVYADDQVKKCKAQLDLSGQSLMSVSSLA